MEKRLGVHSLRMTGRGWSRTALLVTALIVPGILPAAEQDQSDIDELRRFLEELNTRIEALEAEGDPDRAREIAAIQTLLDEAADRLAVLAPEPAPEPEPPPIALPEGPVGDEVPGGIKFADFYGSLRVRSLITSDGEFEVIDRFSRVGLGGAYPGGKGWSVLGRLELGVNVVNQNPVIDIGGDPGYAFGEGADAVTTRLGYVGVATPFGQLTWGKQWGVYYDIASWTDQYYTFGGDGVGAYALGDGGINGTGRAENATQYRIQLGPVDVGLQVQNRDRTDNDQSFADTFGGSLRYSVIEALTLGLAYNEVRDGVDEPGSNQPHTGDRALILGGRWEAGALYVALTVARGERRDRDDTGALFDSRGAELYAGWAFDEHWSVFGGFNLLEPTGDDQTHFRILEYLIGAAYRLGPHVVISAEGRLSDNRSATGDPLRSDTISFGIDFGW